MLTIKIPSAKEMVKMPLREVETLLSLVSDDLKERIVRELFRELHKCKAPVTPTAPQCGRHSIVIITL